MTSLLSNSRALDLSRIISNPWTTQMPTLTRASASWPPCTTATRPLPRVSAWACPELATDPRDDKAIVALQEQGVLA